MSWIVLLYEVLWKEVEWSVYGVYESKLLFI